MAIRLHLGLCCVGTTTASNTYEALSPSAALPVNQTFFYLNPFCFWLGYHTTVFKIQISYAPCHCKSTIHMRLSQTVPGNEATTLLNPVQKHKRKSK